MPTEKLQCVCEEDQPGMLSQLAQVTLTERQGRCDPQRGKEKVRSHRLCCKLGPRARSLGFVFPGLRKCVSSFSGIWLFCNPLDCSPPGSSVHGILQARILEWVAISFSVSYPTQLSKLALLLCRQILAYKNFTKATLLWNLILQTLNSTPLFILSSLPRESLCSALVTQSMRMEVTYQF